MRKGKVARIGTEIEDRDGVKEIAVTIRGRGERDDGCPVGDCA